jgi:hypothetical protein
MRIQDTIYYTQEVANKADARQWDYVLNDLANFKIVRSRSGVSSCLLAAVFIHLLSLG